jgi:hypothetical protein
MQHLTVITKTGSDMIDGSQMIGKTGWTWAAAIDAHREHAREMREYPDPVERALAARFAEFGDGVDFLDASGDESSVEGIDLDEALEHRRDARELQRTHRTPAQRAAHRHGECACFRRC